MLNNRELLPPWELLQHEISEMNKQCEIKDDHYVFTKRHKTSAVRGPAPTQLSNILKILLQKYMDKWRRKYDSDSVFVSNAGASLKSNEVGHIVKRHLMKCNIGILNTDLSMSMWRRATSSEMQHLGLAAVTQEIQPIYVHGNFLQ